MEQKNINMDYNIRKIYTLFLKKNCGEHSPFPITEYLVKFLKETSSDELRKIKTLQLTMVKVIF